MAATESDASSSEDHARNFQQFVTPWLRWHSALRKCTCARANSILFLRLHALLVRTWFSIKSHLLSIGSTNSIHFGTTCWRLKLPWKFIIQFSHWRHEFTTTVDSCSSIAQYFAISSVLQAEATPLPNFGSRGAPKWPRKIFDAWSMRRQPPAIQETIFCQNHCHMGSRMTAWRCHWERHSSRWCTTEYRSQISCAWFTDSCIDYTSWRSGNNQLRVLPDSEIKEREQNMKLGNIIWITKRGKKVTNIISIQRYVKAIVIEETYLRECVPIATWGLWCTSLWMNNAETLLKPMPDYNCNLDFCKGNSLHLLAFCHRRGKTNPSEVHRKRIDRVFAPLPRNADIFPLPLIAVKI